MPPRSRSKWLQGAILAVGVAIGTAPVPAAAAGDVGTAVSVVSADSVGVLRGTETEIPRHASGLRWAGRTLLFPPYVAMRVATWPLVKVAEAEDRAHALSRLASLLRFGYSRGPVTSTISFGYESSVGFSLVGIDATSEDWPTEGARLRLGGGYLSDTDNLLAFQWIGPPRKLQWSGLARLENESQRPFHGLGPASPEEEREADRHRVLGELSLTLRPGKALQVTTTGFARHEALSADAENAAAFPELFAAARRSDYVGAEAEVRWDTRRPGVFFPRGWFVRALGGTDHATSSGDADYRHWLVEAHTRFPVWRRTRTLAFRVLAEGVVSDDPDAVPFPELVRLGGRHDLRGYGSNRFTDRTGLVLTAEYGYPVSTRMFGSLFVDWGTVAPRADELRLADVDPSVGLGFAYVLGGPYGFRAHAAHGPEGFEFALSSEVLFDRESRRRR
ncbi:MAG: BamA/TamA family outer membrane protein [bacterium]